MILDEPESPERLQKIRDALLAGEAVYCPAPLSSDYHRMSQALTGIRPPVNLTVGYHHIWTPPITWIWKNIDPETFTSIVIHAAAPDEKELDVQIEQMLTIPALLSNGKLGLQRCLRPNEGVHVAVFELGEQKVPVTLVAETGPQSFLASFKTTDGRTFEYIGTDVVQAALEAFRAGVEPDARCALGFSPFVMWTRAIWKATESELLSRFHTR